MKWRHLKDLIDAMPEAQREESAAVLIPMYKREFKLCALVKKEDALLQGDGSVLVAEIGAVA